MLSNHCGAAIMDGEKHDPMFMNSFLPQGTHTSSCGHAMHSDCWQGCVPTLIKFNCKFLSVRAYNKLVLIRQVLQQSDHAGATARTALPRVDRHRELRVLVSLLQMPQQYCDTSRASAALAQHKVCVVSYRVTLFSSCDVCCISAMSPSWSCRWATG